MPTTMTALGDIVLRQYPVSKRRFNILGGPVQGRPRELATRRGAKRSRPSDLSKIRRGITGQTRKLLEPKGSRSAASIRTGQRSRYTSLEKFKSYTKSLVSSFKGG